MQVKKGVKKLANRTYVGKTETGKTTLAVKHMLESNKGVLFINYVDKNKARKGFVNMDRNGEPKLLLNLLNNRRNVQWNVDINKNQFDKEVIMLYDFVISNRIKNIVFAIDETHLLKKKTADYIASLWKIGRHNEIDCYCMTQRPQDTPRAMITQSKQLYLFKLSFEDSWLKSYGISMETVPTENYKYEVIEM